MSLKNKIELINRLLTCKGCTCCDAGTVYVFPGEVDLLESSGVKVVETFDYNFIPQGKNGCLYNDPIKRECTIYKKRPICCQIFPFDVYLSDNEQKLYWIYYKKCYKIVKLINNIQNTRAIIEVLNSIERDMSEEDILDFYK